MATKSKSDSNNEPDTNTINGVDPKGKPLFYFPVQDRTIAANSYEDAKKELAKEFPEVKESETDAGAGEEKPADDGGTE